MRRLAFTILGFAFSGLLSVPASASDCSADVLTAFQKQRTSKAFRVAMTQPSAEGDVEMTVDYMPPDRMLQTVKSPAMPGEQQTMLVGNHAYAGTDGAYEELLPQFTQSIIAEFNSAMGSTGKDIGSFECLGKTKFEGKDYLAFRALDKAAPAGTAPDKILARTIYVDEVTGLPAFNVVAAASGKDAPVLKAVYSYPTDVVIEAPKGAPVQKVR
ncbi:MAG: hypothetical protein KDJ17_04400 [Hyphomicrobiaceae bacterium]|nr:hypothetical protein [Hyphomicrobiaceae bacterium]